jgi:hypothetical protein
MCRLRSFAILSGRLQEHRRALEFSSKPLSRPTQRLELSSVLAARSHRQQTTGEGYRGGKSDTPSHRSRMRSGYCPNLSREARLFQDLK